MAEMTSIKMSKFDNQPWGFRLQGGIDFCAPLTVQKVNGGSLAEKAGLRVGDALIRVNTTDIFQLRHKEAQDAVARAGNNFELVVSRGGGMPKTAVKPSDVIDNILPVQAPPAPVQQKTDGSGVKMVNRQFNSPMGLYSEESIAETLSSQAEVLSQGVLGVNFKKNDKTYDPGNSEVFKMIQEMDKAPKEPEPDRHQHMAHSATPTHKPMSFNSPVSMAVNNFGGGALSPSAHHPPPVGGVRIFPVAPAPAPAKPQVKFDESVEEVKVENTVSSMMGTVISSSSSCFNSSTVTTIEETVATSTTSLTSHEPAAIQGPAPPAVKSVSFTPAARPSEPASGNRVVWPPVPSEPEEPHRNVALPAAFEPPSPLPTMQQNPFASLTATAATGVVDSDGIPFALDGLTPSPFAAAAVPAELVVEPPTPVADVPPPLVPTPVVEVPVRMPSPIPSTLTGLKASPISVLGYGGGGDDGGKPTDFGQMLQQQQQQQHHHHHEPSNPGLAGFGSAAAVAASAAMAAQAQHQQQQALPPQLPPQMPQQPPKGAGSGIQSAPRRGKGVLNQQVAAGARVPVCASCKAQIRGKFVTALGQTWCPNHFSCAMPDCKRELHDIGFVEEKKQLYCEGCFETHLAPNCSRCSKRVKGDCLNAIGKQFHPECFSCTYCGSLFGNSHFYLEDGLPYCEADWNELFTTKCYACGYPIEAGDRWVEAMNNNYHSQCFNCSVCKKNLEGQSFLGKSGRPMCKSHAR
ncbi:PDZ and LIM domain protein Zasp-like isoform X8 [Daphnia pulex]|uniref:PDZ and LIM domain protein Zasp-like isoform X8 n=1 Tax=Daphnia pulex TaxID=6669 RepID=UPI001EE02EEE|nr:PDZ and LIM domain protein Zasp-like isoform X8 [Daphnia pulex]